jgi:hypothetical protein
MAKVKINLDNPLTLQTLPGLDHSAVEVILRFRAEHGPIQNPAQLASILGGRPLNPGLLERRQPTPHRRKLQAPDAQGALTVNGGASRRPAPASSGPWRVPGLARIGPGRADQGPCRAS